MVITPHSLADEVGVAEGVREEDTLWTAFHRTGARTCHGFAIDRARPERRFAVEILIDGVAVQLLRADALTPEVAQAGIGDGHHGFAYALPDEVDEAVVVEARLANFDLPLGEPIAFARAAPTPEHAPAGVVRWGGGLVIEGWVAADARDVSAPVPVSLAVDGEAPITVLADRWQHVGGDTLVPGRAFVAHLPPSYADGAVHEVRAASGGRVLEGSPLTFAAFPTADAARTALQILADGDQSPLSDWLGRLLPRSLPFSAYDAVRPPPLPARPHPSPLAVVLLGPDGPEAAQESLIAQTHQRWAAINGAETDEPFALDPAALSSFLAEEAADATLVVFAPTSFVFAPDAFDALDGSAEAAPGASLIYGDFLAIGGGPEAGRSWPMLLPAFDEVRLTEQGYCTLVFAARREAVLTALTEEPRTSLDLFFRVLAPRRDDEDAVAHLPRALGTALVPDQGAFADTLEAAVLPFLAQVAPGASVSRGQGGWFPALHVRRTAEVGRTISVIVSAHDEPGALESCLGSLESEGGVRPHEIVIADGGSRDLATLALLAEAEAKGQRVIRASAWQSRASLLNEAAAQASGDLLLFLDGRIALADSDGLAEMAGRLDDARVGAVGALVHDADGIVVDGGYVLSTDVGARRAFTDHLAEDAGFAGWLRVARRSSAVSAFCMMVRASLFRGASGFDAERFPNHFADVDFGLRLGQKGHQIVWTPYARAVAQSRRTDRTDAVVTARAVEALRARWAHALPSDSFYHPGLTSKGVPYSGLALHARSLPPHLPRGARSASGE